MQKGHLILLVVFLGVAASVAAGDVWINCEAGFDIFLDGESAGVSEADESGKHLRGIESGHHTIRIEEGGIALAEFSVNVGFAPNQVEVGELAAGMTEALPGTSQEAAETMLVGTIEITSDPGECNVKIGRRRIQKKHPIMTMPGIPVGEHKLWFESSGTVLKETVRVQTDQPARVMVDFRNQRVVITGATPAVPEGDSTVEEEPRTEPECIEYWIEVLRTDYREEIEPYQQSLKELGFPRENQKIITIDNDGGVPTYKLRVGPIERAKKAKWAAGLIRNAGIPTVWVLPEACLPPSERPKREFRPTH